MRCISNHDEHMKELIKGFNAYTLDYEDSPEVIELKSQYILSAKQIVEEYLGYSIDIKEQIDRHIYIGSRDIPLRSCPVDEIYGVKINGEYIPAPYYTLIENDTLRLSCECHIPCSSEIVIEYCSGWRKIPEIVTQTIFRIASLLKTESNSNIGITSKSYSDGSRSFTSFTNFDKYLSPLYPIRTYKLT